MTLAPSPLGAHHHVLAGALPGPLAGLDFDRLWALHPAHVHTVQLMGRTQPCPRWSQAYGRDYRYTGSVNRAAPLPSEFEPFLAAARTLHPGLNGLLVNWYDGELGHYIGKHRDATGDLLAEAPIVTFSLGAARTFRFRKYRGPGIFDFSTAECPVLAFNTEVNRVFSHEVPPGQGRRISVTVRGFSEPSVA